MVSGFGIALQKPPTRSVISNDDSNSVQWCVNTTDPLFVIPSIDIEDSRKLAHVNHTSLTSDFSAFYSRFLSSG